MKQLTPLSGKGRSRTSEPSARVDAGGALILNSAAFRMIEAKKWLVSYEDDSNKSPALVLEPAQWQDAAGHAVARNDDGEAMITMRALWREIENEHARRFVGHYSVTATAKGLKLDKMDD